MTDEFSLRANGIEFHLLAQGPEDGPLVVLLHGFPELARSWRHQLSALASAGYRAVAPDQRGYGRTERRRPYDVTTLADDAAAIIGELGRKSAYVVGHDWGGAVAWTLAQEQPEVVRGLVAANCPPPSVMAREFMRNPAQLRKSWYMFFFQLPVLPDRLLARSNADAVGKILVRGSYVRSAFPAEEIAAYRREFSRPGAATAALSWYREAVRHPFRGTRSRTQKITCPTLVLWGIHDVALEQKLVAPDRLAQVMADGNEPEVVYFDDAGHFIQNESPDRFNKEMISWLERQKPTI